MLSRVLLNCTAAVLLASLSAAPVGGRQAPGSPEEATFKIFFRARDIGGERFTVDRSAEGITIAAAGALVSPLDLTIKKFEARYDASWRPLELVLEGTARGQTFGVRTRFSGTSAVSEITQGTNTTTKTDTVAADTIILPNNVFGAYEAVVNRLEGKGVGHELSVYVAPQAEVKARVADIVDERLQIGRDSIAARRYRVTFLNPGRSLDIDIWAGERNRLLRVSVPDAGLDAVRDDIASVSTRQQHITRPGDEDISVPATGFSLATTISKPAGAAAGARLPAVILVPGSGPTDRDETVAGIPILGQIANALADAGFIVARYDKRGVGQSGGRTETATLADYAEDVRAVLRELRRRKDVDRDRISLVGHSEGGWVSLIAASRESDDVDAVVLAAAAATTGAELILEQQRHALERLDVPDAERQQKVELQKKIHAAVASGEWEGIAPELRRQADSPWFQSLLAFDPAAIMRRVRQPILIVQGSLDRQVPEHHARALADLARQRKKGGPVEVEIFPGINHLLVQATTGEVDEYASLKGKSVDAAVVARVAEWLKSPVSGNSTPRPQGARTR
jgi:pimeloyl-ACP methyl ester carboxylesterase